MKQLIVFITILLMQGCAFYDLEKINSPKYLVEPVERISKVVFESGNSIQFNMNGGGYYNLKNSISGVTDYNKFIVVPIDNIRNIVTSSETLLTYQFLKTDSTGIQQIILTNGMRHTFIYLPGGGRYHKDELKVIAGIDTRSKFYEFGTDSVSYLEINKFNSTKSCLVNIGIVSVVVAAIIYFIADSFTIGPLNLTF
jgi:hypothetical protein